MTAEVVPTSATGAEVATIPDTVAELVGRYTALSPADDLHELIKLATGEDTLVLRRKDITEVTVPAAGTNVFSIPDSTEEDGTRAVKKITGIVTDWWKPRGYWVDPDPSGKPPNCASRDGKIPIADGLFGPRGAHGPKYNPGGTCETCPMSKFGSARDPKNPGKRGRGQACKESMSVVTLTGDEMLPMIVRAPATSLDSIRMFMVQLLLKKKVPFFAAEVEFSLVVDENASGQKFNKIGVRVVRELDEAQTKVVLGYRNDFVLPLTEPWKTNPESMELANEDYDEFDDAMYGLGSSGHEVAEDAEIADEAPAGRGTRR